jgi:hypothetical protein
VTGYTELSDRLAARWRQLAPIVLRLGLDQPNDAERIEARPLRVDSALRDAGLLGALGRRAAEYDNRSNQLKGVLLGPCQRQAQLRPVLGGLMVGPLARCHVADFRLHKTHVSQSTQHSDLTSML